MYGIAEKWAVRWRHYENYPSKNTVLNKIKDAQVASSNKLDKQ